MHKGIAAKIDPGFLGNVPNIVIFTYLAMFVALLLYIIANPTFFARMGHMDLTGQAPMRLRVEPMAQVAGNRTVSEPQPLQIAAPVKQGFWSGLMGRNKQQDAITLAQTGKLGQVSAPAPAPETGDELTLTPGDALRTARRAGVQARHSQRPMHRRRLQPGANSATRAKGGPKANL
jgi:hypothetical protein